MISTCCCESCPPIFGIIAYYRPGFKQLTGTSTKRWLTQHYTYYFAKREAIPDTFPVEYEIVEWNYELTLTVNRRSGQVTISETSDLDSTQLTYMHARLNALDLGSATDSAGDTDGDVFGGGQFGGLIVWSIDLTDLYTLEDDLEELEDMTDESETLIGTLTPDVYYQLGYPFYSGTAQMIPFKSKASVTGFTSALGTAITTTYGIGAGGHIDFFGYWWTGITAYFSLYPPKYPCSFNGEPVAIGFGPTDLKSSIDRCFLKVGDGDICAAASVQTFNTDTGAAVSSAAKCFAGTDGYILFDMPTATTRPVLIGAPLTSPGYLGGGADGCPCSVAP
jgi:hypothetical protein